MANHLWDLVQARFPTDLRRPFLEQPDGRVLTYGGLETMTARLANLLVARGVGPGDRVAVQVEKCAEMLALYLACLRAGAVFLPLNPAYTAAEIGHFLADAEPRLMVADPARVPQGTEPGRAPAALAVETLAADGGGSLMTAAAALPETFADQPRRAADLAALLYTSGTTGRSKGAMLSHGNLAANALTLHRVWGFRPDDVLLHILPIFHTHGLFVATNCVLLNGTGMLFCQKFDPGLVIDLLPRATVLMGVPTHYVRLLGDPRLGRQATSGMRLFIAGSAPLLPQTFHAFEALTGHRILERYGMTETGMNTSNPLEGERRPGTVGPALPDVQLRVVDEAGQPVPAGTVGMIEVKGPNVFQGYWRLPEKTAAEFRPDGFFITGDLGRIDGDGYVSIVGRGKDLIISGGLNVYPKEVEEVIDGLAGIAESAVIGLPHPDFGEAVVAVAIARPGAAVTEAQVIAACRERLAVFKCPKRVIFVPDLPRNTMGKVQKNALRDAHAQALGS